MQERTLAFADIEATLKRSCAALHDAGVPFLLGGSLASWARGGPESSHDLDLVLKPEDAERASKVLEEIGMRPERPPEDWLLKAWDGEILVDLIFSPKGLAVDDELIARGEEMAVSGMTLRVMALEDILVTKLLALDEHRLDYDGLLRMSRALREQVRWEEVRARTERSPFARAFFTLLEGLAIVEPGASRAADRVEVSVVEPPRSVAG